MFAPSLRSDLAISKSRIPGEPRAVRPAKTCRTRRCQVRYNVRYSCLDRSVTEGRSYERWDRQTRPTGAGERGISTPDCCAGSRIGTIQDDPAEHRRCRDLGRHGRQGPADEPGGRSAHRMDRNRGAGPAARASEPVRGAVFCFSLQQSGA
jgi:hypothetical protein